MSRDPFEEPRSISEAQRRWRRENPSTRYPLDYILDPNVVQPIRRTIGFPSAYTIGIVALITVAGAIKNRRG